MNFFRPCFVLAGVLLLLLNIQARADVLLSDFSNFGTQSPSFSGSWEVPVAQYTQNTNFISITAVSGGNPRDDGTVSVGASPDATGLSFAQVSARIDSGNLAAQFILSLTDSSAFTAAATFATSSFTTGGFTTISSALVFEPGFDPSSIIFWQIGGGSPTPTADFRVSFDNASLVSDITPIPEPTLGAFAWVFAAGAYSLCRRKRKA